MVLGTSLASPEASGSKCIMILINKMPRGGLASPEASGSKFVPTSQDMAL